jgi:hypothetical protein
MPYRYKAISSQFSKNLIMLELTNLLEFLRKDFKTEITKERIKYISIDPLKPYETATDNAITELNVKLNELELRLSDLKEMISKPCLEAEQIKGEMSWILDERASTIEHLTALEEMKIVYLFKSLEINMKSLINIAYPKISTKEAYNWNSMVNIFKSLDIELTKLDGYPEATELKTINNSIKHSGAVNGDVKRIAEFKQSVEIDFEKLSAFYNRIKLKIVNFKEQVGQSVYDSLYQFNDERIENITLDYLKRMNKETAKKFVEEFNKKINEKYE